MQSATSTPKVFISYRRAESGGHAGRLYDAMVARVGERNVFMDIDMPPGVDFVDRITDVVGSCRVLLVVMAPGWAQPAAGEQVPRIDDPEDFVRLEVATALSRPDVTVIPLLVEGAEMPDPEDLPASLRSLARRNALELSDTRWRADVGRLLDVLESLLGEGSNAPAAAPGAGAGPAATAGGTSRPPPRTLPGLLRHRWQIATIAAAAITVLLVVVLAGGSDEPGASRGPGAPITTASDAARPLDVREGCTDTGETQFARDLEAKTQWDCDASGAEGVVGPALNYLEYTTETGALSALAGARSFQLDNGWRSCRDADLKRYYPHEASCLIAGPKAEEDEGTIELTWHGGGSKILGHMTFDPPTTVRDGVQAWSKFV